MKIPKLCLSTLLLFVVIWLNHLDCTFTEDYNFGERPDQISFSSLLWLLLWTSLGVKLWSKLSDLNDIMVLWSPSFHLSAPAFLDSSLKILRVFLVAFITPENRRLYFTALIQILASTILKVLSLLLTTHSPVAYSVNIPVVYFQICFQCGVTFCSSVQSRNKKVYLGGWKHTFGQRVSCFKHPYSTVQEQGTWFSACDGQKLLSGASTYCIWLITYKICD